MKITILKKSRSHGLKKYNFSEVQVISILLFVLAAPFLAAFVTYQYVQTPKEQPLYGSVYYESFHPSLQPN